MIQEWAHIISTIVVGLIVLGRWLQAREGGEAVTRKDLAALERRVHGEHDERKRLVEQINVAIGTLQVEGATRAEHLRALEDDVKELRRKVFNGAGV